MKRDTKIGFVILNYKTYKDTLKCLQSLKKNEWDNINIYVVENGSQNLSHEILSSKKLREKYHYTYLHSTINTGFAQGNNLGITAARDDGCEFIICSNSDITIQSQAHPAPLLLELFTQDPNITVIAPNIQNLDGIYQNPFRLHPFSLLNKIAFFLFFGTGFDRFYFLLRTKVLYNIITIYTKWRNKKRISNTKDTTPNSGYIYAPQGSFLIFTPTFFKFFDGFDPHTFLYCEEYILAELLRVRKLKIYFDTRIQVLHKESGTINIIALSYKDKVQFTLKQTFASCRYFTKYILHFKN